MKLEDLKAGDIVIVDDGFDCLAPGEHTVRITDKGRLYLICGGLTKGDDPDAKAADGTGSMRHWLDGQEDEDGNGELIGLTMKATP